MAVSQEQLFVGTRPLGMGGAFIAVADDGNTITWNQTGGFIAVWSKKRKFFFYFLKKKSPERLSFLLKELVQNFAETL